ncbi:MAG TPA: DUF1080 domain-containing protein [Planctomycetota bacterium]|jgi:hypothetical protein
MLTRILSLSILLAGVVFAGAPNEALVQGLYEGTLKDGKLEVRVVGQGDGKYRVLVRNDVGGGKIEKAELWALTAGDEVSISGKSGETEWKAVYADGAFKGTAGAVAFEIKRVERKSPTMGKAPPEGAIVLLDGKDFKEIVRANGAEWFLGDMSKHGAPVWEVPLVMIGKDPAEWPSAEKPLPEGWKVGKERRRADMVIGIGEDGSIQVPKGGINSAKPIEGSFDYHVEFMNPFQPKEHSQGRGNSGVYLPNGQEIQVLDSFGECTYTGGGCGGLYAYQDPLTMDTIESIKPPENKYNLTSLPPGTWQTYDIQYRVEKKDGKWVGKPKITVFFNGIKIHDNVELKQDAKKGAFHLQDHGNAVRYRNIWAVPVDK